MSSKILQIHPDDNVLVALSDLKKGEVFLHHQQSITLQSDVSAKHKFAIKPLTVGEKVIMYGITVGRAVQPITSGGAITTENVKHAAEPFQGKTQSYAWKAPDVTRWKERTFLGYHRSDGQVGVRNFWLVVPLVFCENRNLQTIKEAFLKELGYAQPDVYRDQVRRMMELYKAGSIDSLRDLEFSSGKTSGKPQRLFKNVDGIKFLFHESGCGGTREDANNLCALIAGYSVNPNVAGITVLSLGCQNAQADILKSEIKKRDPQFDKPLFIFEQQKMNTEFILLSEAIKQTFIGLTEIDKLKRAPAPLSKLSVGVKCGGSDGFSGISANPAMGYTADLITALGGKVMMAEFPELCGVEQELLNRCVDDATANRFATLMKEYAARAEAVGSGFDMNPSPGNIKDGLITDAMKSAGAAKKGGTSPVADVLGYARYATKPGLNLVCTPGNDVESTSGMAGAGATIQLFSTGLGTPTGNPISPMVKIATNNPLAQRMPDIIDINAGPIITGEKKVEEVGEEILEYVIHLANGEYDTKAMELGQDDFIFWRRGVSL